MRRYGYESGHSPGGVDVTEAVNLAFKGILLSPIFILCIFITIAMLKHMIFGGIPTMNQPTEAQREELRERDSEINPREVWGGSSSEVSPSSQQPEFVEKEPEVVPFTIHDGPNWNQKNLDNSGWKTEILEDPFS